MPHAVTLTQPSDPSLNCGVSTTDGVVPAGAIASVSVDLVAFPVTSHSAG